MFCQNMWRWWSLAGPRVAHYIKSFGRLLAAFKRGPKNKKRDVLSRNPQTVMAFILKHIFVNRKKLVKRP